MIQKKKTAIYQHKCCICDSDFIYERLDVTTDFVHMGETAHFINCPNCGSSEQVSFHQNNDSRYMTDERKKMLQFLWSERGSVDNQRDYEMVIESIIKNYPNLWKAWIAYKESTKAMNKIIQSL